MKRQLTPEQERNRDARRARMAELIKRASAMTPEQRQELFSTLPLVVNTDGKALSVRNTILIHWQIENPTIVGGFRQWIKAGRVVRKGEHGASILFPRNVGTETSRESGEPQEKIAFLSGTVFDIGQTEVLDAITTEEQAA